MIIIIIIFVDQVMLLPVPSSNVEYFDGLKYVLFLDLPYLLNYIWKRVLEMAHLPTFPRVPTIFFRGPLSIYLYL